MRIDPSSIPFTPGYHRVSTSCYAWLQPGGGFSLCNSGLVYSGGKSLVIDTLIDVPRTRRLIADMLAITGRPDVDFLVNTHGDLDHTAGNCLFEGCHHIMSKPAAAFYARLDETIATLSGDDPNLRAMMSELGFDAFDFSEVRHAPPTEIYHGHKLLTVGEREVVLHEFGPAHSLSDTVVHVPEEGVTFTGDLVFCNCHPVLGHQPLQNWVDACNEMLASGSHMFVPGHGPVCGPDEIVRHRDYVLELFAEAQACHAAGLSIDEAALHIFEKRVDWHQLFRGDILRKNVFVAYNQIEGRHITENLRDGAIARLAFRNHIRGRSRGINPVPHHADGN